MEPEVSVSNAPHATGNGIAIVTGHLCNKGYLFSVRLMRMTAILCIAAMAMGKLLF